MYRCVYIYIYNVIKFICLNYLYEKCVFSVCKRTFIQLYRRLRMAKVVIVLTLSDKFLTILQAYF